MGDRYVVRRRRPSRRGEWYRVGHRPLVERRSRHALPPKTGYHNLHVPCGDGTLGWSEHAPYASIIATAGAHSLLMEPPGAGGREIADPERDLAKLVVLERHRGTGRVGLRLVRGLGIMRGALASSVAHDSHNLITAGVDDVDIVAALTRLIEQGGGLSAAADVLAPVALPVLGLMSDQPLGETMGALRLLDAQARELGDGAPGLQRAVIPRAARDPLATPDGLRPGGRHGRPSGRVVHRVMTPLRDILTLWQQPPSPDRRPRPVDAA